MTTCIDTDNLLKGENYNELNEVFIIFICTFDPFDRGRPHYTLKTRCLQERDLDIADGVTKEIFNATAYAKEQDVEISAFLKYIDSKSATDDFTDKINRIVETAKINEKFRSTYLAMNIRESDIRLMAFNEGRNAGIADGIAQGISQGAEQKAIETAKQGLLMNLSFKQISELTGLSLDTVKNLADELKNCQN